MQHVYAAIMGIFLAITVLLLIRVLVKRLHAESEMQELRQSIADLQTAVGAELLPIFERMARDLDRLMRRVRVR